MSNTFSSLTAGMADDDRNRAALDAVTTLPDDLKKRAAVEAVGDLGDADKKEAVAQITSANPDLFPGNDHDRTMLWMTVLVGMFVLAIVVVIADVILSVHYRRSDSTALVAVVSAIVAGVIGLFANPPRGGQ